MVDLTDPTYPEVRYQPFADFAWPEGKRCGVTVAWHVDGEAGPIYWDRRATNHLASVSEAAYGVTTAMPRILELHRRYEIPATFFVPAHVAERHPAMVEAILRDGHEIGHHGFMHENVFDLSFTDELAIFTRATETLVKMTGQAPAGWSAPGWAISPQTVAIMLQQGLIYDASLMEYDRPYLITVPAGQLIELPISMVLDDWALFGGTIYPFGTPVIAPANHARQIWQEEFEGLRHFGGLFQSTFHPKLTGRPGRLRMLAGLFAYMRTFEDVWWGTCAQLAQQIQGEYL